MKVYYQILENGDLGQITNDIKLAKLSGFYNEKNITDEKNIVKINGKNYLKDTLSEEEYINITNITKFQKEILELRQKLNDTDYKAIRYAEGSLTAEEFESIKQQRIEWRNRIKELELSVLNI